MTEDKFLPKADYAKLSEDKQEQKPESLQYGQALKLADIVGVRITCRSAKRLSPEKVEYCGGQLEGKPDEILANKTHKFQIKCPKCNAEFSRGMRFHIMSDQVKGICELVLALQRSHFGVEFLMKDDTNGPVSS